MELPCRGHRREILDVLVERRVGGRDGDDRGLDWASRTRHSQPPSSGDRGRRETAGTLRETAVPLRLALQCGRNAGETERNGCDTRIDPARRYGAKVADPSDPEEGEPADHQAPRQGVDHRWGVDRGEASAYARPIDGARLLRRRLRLASSKAAVSERVATVTSGAAASAYTLRGPLHGGSHGARTHPPDDRGVRPARTADGRTSSASFRDYRRWTSSTSGGGQTYPGRASRSLDPGSVAGGRGAPDQPSGRRRPRPPRSARGKARRRATPSRSPPARCASAPAATPCA